jgi:NitT/TauT family transport system substrate-binding protein
MARLSRRDLLRNAAYGASAALTVAACAPLDRMPFRPPAPSSPAGAAASLPDAPRDSVGGPPVTVHVGVNRIMPEAALYFAIDRGHFRQAGMAVELVPTSSGVESMQLLASGQVDVSFAGVTAALFNVVQRGVVIKLTVTTDVYYPGASTLFLMVRHDLLERGEIRDYGDLAGHRVAVPVRGAFSHYVVALALRRAGLDADAVELVELPFTDATVALASGAISAAIQTEPLATVAADQGIAAKWRSAGDVRPGLVGAGFFYSSDLVGRRRAVGERWMVAYLQGVRDYNALLGGLDGRAEIAATLSRYTAVTDPGLYARMALPNFSSNGDLDLAVLDEQRRWHVEQRSAPAAVAVSQAVDTSFAELAVRQLGRVAEGAGRAPSGRTA